MSTYPNNLDAIPLVPDLTPLGSDALTFDEAKAPASLIAALNGAVLATECQAGFTLLTGGDTRADGTQVTAGYGRVLALVQGSWCVTAAQGGHASLYVPVATALAEETITRCSPAPVTSPAGLSPLSATLSPSLVLARRRVAPLSLAASVVCFPDGSAQIAVSLSAGDAPFVSGEMLDLSLVFVGGA